MNKDAENEKLLGQMVCKDIGWKILNNCTLL